METRPADEASSSGSELMTALAEIIDLSKIEAEHIDLADIAFNLRDSVAGAVAALGATVRARDLELATWVDAGLPRTVCGDGPRLRQVLVSLLADAVALTPAGTVTLRAIADGVREGRVDLRVEIGDTGGGIDGASLEHMFDPFSPATGSTARRSGATGLGLGSAKRLVELMGGEMGVRSTPGEGRTVWLTLQLGLTAAAEAGPGQAGIAGDRVLIVVDERATNRMILERQLAGCGMAGDTAANPGEALVLLHTTARSECPYRLVVFDSEMPQMSGPDLAAAIRGTPVLGSVRLLMLTGSGSGRALASDAGVDGFLVKPVSQASLQDELMRVLAPADAGAGAPRPARREGATRWSKGTVLVAEDSNVNQLVAVRQLERRGFQVDLASNGREAVTMHARGSYELILMDCQMPELDGYEATGEIRVREGVGRHTPIIALTADTTDGARDRCLGAGMDDYLSKPVRPDRLDEVLSRALPPLYPAPGL